MGTDPAEREQPALSHEQPVVPRDPLAEALDASTRARLDDLHAQLRALVLLFASDIRTFLETRYGWIWRKP